MLRLIRIVPVNYILAYKTNEEVLKTVETKK